MPVLDPQSAAYTLGTLRPGYLNPVSDYFHCHMYIYLIFVLILAIIGSLFVHARMHALI